jgi:hypothetical protein
VLIALLTAVTGSAHDVSDEQAHSRAFRVASFWDRVSCVDISVTAYIKDEKQGNVLQEETEDAVTARLLTVWRREMPDVAAGRAGRFRSKEYKSSECLEKTPRQQSSPSWSPDLSIDIFADEMRTGQRYYGVVTPRFSVTFFDRSLNTLCNPLDRCVTGPTHTEPAAKHPHPPKSHTSLFSYRTDVEGYASGLRMIFYGSTRSDIETTAIEAGEKLIKKIAEMYYESKSYLKEWRR